MNEVRLEIRVIDTAILIYVQTCSEKRNHLSKVEEIKSQKKIRIGLIRKKMLKSPCMFFCEENDFLRIKEIPQEIKCRSAKYSSLLKLEV